MQAGCQKLEKGQRAFLKKNLVLFLAPFAMPPKTLKNNNGFHTVPAKAATKHEKFSNTFDRLKTAPNTTSNHPRNTQTQQRLGKEAKTM